MSFLISPKPHMQPECDISCTMFLPSHAGVCIHEQLDSQWPGQMPMANAPLVTNVECSTAPSSSTQQFLDTAAEDKLVSVC